MKQVVISIVAVSILVMPASAARPRWPSNKELQRCVPAAMKSAKLREWCKYWSEKMP